jgi:hypothetical protein
VVCVEFLRIEIRTLSTQQDSAEGFFVVLV